MANRPTVMDSPSRRLLPMANRPTVMDSPSRRLLPTNQMGKY